MPPLPSEPGNSVLVNPITDQPWTSAVSIGQTNVTLGSDQRGDVKTAVGAFTVKAPGPGAISRGVAFGVLDVDANAAINNITIDGNGHTIDGAATLVLTQNGVEVAFLFDRGEWKRVLPPRSYGAGAAWIENADLGGGGGPDVDAVVFDTVAAQNNIRSARTNQSPIDNTKTGVTNLGSRSSGATTGVNADFGTISGGDRNQVSAIGATVPGGRLNIASGTDSMAKGLSCTSAGARSLAGGFLSTTSVDATDSLVYGTSCTTNAADCIAVGNQCAALNNYCSAFGNNANALRSGEFAHSSQGSNNAEGIHALDLYVDTNAAPASLLLGSGGEMSLENLKSYQVLIRILGSRVGVQGTGTEVHELSMHASGGALVVDHDTLITQTGEFLAGTWTSAITAPGALVMRVACNPGAEHAKFLARVEWSALPGA